MLCPDDLMRWLKTKLGMRVCGIALVKPLSGNFDHYVKMFSNTPFIILLTTKWQLFDDIYIIKQYCISMTKELSETLSTD